MYLSASTVLDYSFNKETYYTCSGFFNHDLVDIHFTYNCNKMYITENKHTTPLTDGQLCKTPLPSRNSSYLPTPRKFSILPWKCKIVCIYLATEEGEWPESVELYQPDKSELNLWNYLALYAFLLSISKYLYFIFMMFVEVLLLFPMLQGVRVLR
jgi:hypothetical protein